MPHIVKNLGNFSEAVSEGMIGYGRETPRGRGRKEADDGPEMGDGYATKEADILLGGFIQRRAAQEASWQGESLASLSVERKEKLALHVWKQHLQDHGTAGPEHYRHWLVRVESFARRRSISLPPKEGKERDYDYSRRLRKWIDHQPENAKWPKLEPAAGTHLVFSPEPKIFQALRALGEDERPFLKQVLTQTMKDFGDWRRNLHGPGHSLGWVAGTHVRDNGAARHPHIHVVVLKRDEAGKAVDWSVSSLKGHQGRNDPDPMRELKRFFDKNISKELERTIGKEAAGKLLAGEPAHTKPPSFRHSPSSDMGRRIQQLGYGLRAVARAMQPCGVAFQSFMGARGRETELGAMMRLLAMIQKHNPSMRLSSERLQERPRGRQRPLGRNAQAGPEMEM